MNVSLDVGMAEPQPGEPVVRARNLQKSFRRASGEEVRAIDDVSFDVAAGEFVVILGPSGCGKTTLLNTIAGLERPEGGSLQIGGATVFDSARRVYVAAERRHISMVFQSYALWPHMTVRRNVAFPLETRGGRFRSGRATRTRVAEILDALGIGDLANQYPSQISGGQAQRVALARALAAGTHVVLFDEPLSNVDAQVREQLRLELLAMQRELGFSAVFVTHDQTEAMMLAHRILVMNSGRVAQAGAPDEVYDHPVSRYVANFIGTSDELEGHVVSCAGDRFTVDTAVGALEVTGRQPAAGRALGPVMLSWRPERCLVSLDRPAGANAWRAVTRSSSYLGAHTEHVLVANGITFRTWSAQRAHFAPGADVWLQVAPDAIQLFHALEAADSGEGDGSPAPVGEVRDTFGMAALPSEQVAGRYYQEGVK